MGAVFIFGVGLHGGYALRLLSDSFQQDVCNKNPD
jgi:hypothetical protein